MSALATIVGSLGELSESELRQLYLMVGVRLGIPDVPPGAKPRAGDRSGNTAVSRRSKGGKASASTSSSKGNPQRKSQWANHPLYQEYSRLKKVVENQAKEGKTSFNAVDTAESRAYAEAFTRWVEAKSSFRGHGESGQIRRSTEEGKESESDSEEEVARTAPTSARQTKSASPPAKPEAGPSETRSSPTKGSSKRPTPSGKGKAAAQ